MKTPHYKYIVTLVAGKMNNQDILRDLQANSLPPPPVKEVNDLRESLKLGQQDYFSNKEAVNLSWLNELGVEAMFGYKFKKQVEESLDGILGAFKVLNDPNMYRTITSLAMASVTPEDIELIVNGKYDVEYSSADLDVFLKYFFDLKSWTRYEKDKYANDITDGQLRGFYKMALNEEKDYLMWKLGVAPNKSFDAMLRDMTVDSYYNFKEQSTRNPDQAQKWGTLMLKVQERLEKVEKDLNADTDAVSDLETIFTKAVENVSGKSKKKMEALIKDESSAPSIINMSELN
jgi:hypothetical protein